MRYTKSKDGVERCTIRVDLRFTREEIADHPVVSNSSQELALF